MKLRRLEVRALPGIEDPFTLEGLADGVNVLLGPNASGKSSVLRAVRALLYEEEARGAGVHLLGVFEDRDGEFRVTRIGDTTQWERAGRRVDRPPLPERHQLGGYLLQVEDLVALNTNDQGIAARLATELAGGFDLQAVRATLTAAPAGQKEAKGHTAAVAELKAAQGRRDALAEQDESLSLLRQQAAQADEEARRLDAYEAALPLLDARRRLAALDASLSDDFPPGLDAWTGDELRVLAELDEAVAEAERDAHEARLDLEEARERLAASGLADASLGLEEVELWQARADRLAHFEDAAQEAVDRRSEADGRIAQLLREGGASAEADAPRAASEDTAPAEPDLRPETIGDLARRLLERDRLAADAASIARERERLEGEEEAPEDPDRLRRARAALLSFAAASERVAARRAGPEAVAWPVATLLLALAAAASAGEGLAAVASPLPLALLALACLAAGLGSVRAHRSGGDVARREAARREYEASGAEPPPAWTADGARDQAEVLARRIAQAEAAASRHASMRARRRELASELERTGAAAEAAAASLREACVDAGIDAGHLDLGWLDRLRWVRDLREARATRAGFAARAQERAAAADELRGALATDLAEAGDGGRETPADAAAASARLRALAARLRARDDARRDVDAARQREDRARKDARRAGARRNELLRRRGLLPEAAEDGAGDAEVEAAVAELRHRSNLLAEWNRLNDERTGVRGEIRSLQASLAAQPQVAALVASEDEDALLRGRDAAREARVRYDELRDEVVRIETLVQAARRERDVERARTRERAARDELESALDAARTAEVGAFLMDRVEAEFRSVRQPAALERAAGWFARFTHHAFSLRFDASRGEREAVFARDETTGRERSLAQLSTGTKAQLLLALRVAFACESERGLGSLPLFLDEALTTTDAKRFEVVAEALITLAREDDRQVFYLSARAADADLWASLGAVNTLDVAEARGSAWSAPSADAFRSHGAPEVPDPTGVSPEDYAVALSVRSFDPWAPLEAHPFHLLRDRLELLATLVRTRIATLGALQALLNDPRHAGTVLDDADRHLVQVRLRAALAWCAAWCAERPRPLSEAALAGCDALTHAFRAQVVELAREAEGDASELLAQLEDRAVSGFGPARIAVLREWLEEREYLIDRSLPPRTDAVLDMVTVLREGGVSDAVAEAERLLRWLESGLGERTDRHRATDRPIPHDG